jgi:sugar lactone lactonase YvrE
MLRFASLFLLFLPLVAHVEEKWLWSTAHVVPKETTSEGSGYFSIIEGQNGHIYVGSAKYGSNAFLVGFDPKSQQMKIAVDCMKEIGSTATGFAAQAKIHTRNNIGPSGKIYFGTKQGYPAKDQPRTDYPGGYPMVYDLSTGKTKVYDIPIKHHGIISVTPDESRNLAYISTCDDGRPIEHSHFMVLDLATGKYTELGDTEHMYAFIVVDAKGRAYHPLRGGEIARYNPDTKKLDKLKQTIDGQPPTKESHLVEENSHPLNWDISPDGKTLWCVAMSGNQLYSYDLTSDGDTLVGKSHGRLIKDADSTDCRALCVAADGRIWAGVNATEFAPANDPKKPDAKKKETFIHLASYTPSEDACKDYGRVAIKNPDYTTFTDAAGKQLPWHHGVYKYADGTTLPRYSCLGVCASRDGTVYLLSLAPFTLHAIQPE